MAASQKLQELYANYADKDYDTLCQEAEKRLALVRPLLAEKVGDAQASTFLLYLVGILVGADGRLSQNELAFIGRLLDENISRHKMESIAHQVSTPSYQATVDKIIDGFAPVLKHNLLMFCLCFLAVDASIDKREATYFEKLIQ
jgi:hypothetical protein